MIFKNTPNQGIYLYACDTTASPPAGKTGDGANINGTVSLDGAAAAAFASGPAEIGAGVYWQPLSQAETNGNAFAFAWASSTTGISIEPLIGFTEAGRIDAAISTRSTLAAGAAMTLADGAITADKIAAAALAGKGDWNTVAPENGSILSILGVVTSGTYGNGAINGKVDALMSRLTAARALLLDKLNVTGILANTDNADTFKAAVSSLATAAALQAVADIVADGDHGNAAIKTLLNAVAAYLDTEIAAILADTNELQTNQGNWITGGDATAENQDLIAQALAGLLTIATEARLSRLDAAISSHDADDVVAALKAATGFTAGGTHTFAQAVKVLYAMAAGTWRDKAGVSGAYEILDPEDAATVIATIIPQTTTPYRQVTQ